MNILLNGELLSLPGPATVYQLLQARELDGRRLAVELNEEILPRSQHKNHQLQPGDRVEIVHAIGGG
ncbi:sulfur carrier protein ThiS [Pseudomonas saliphila]|uniref:sulfur carrier protein ThiS n=1 Tax=Pseudomonas saliphila TaxID=2586906 RepID=UPI0012392258|nr:sulfur carrier protein ThiS [Pseudomonas saliphila]